MLELRTSETQNKTDTISPGSLSAAMKAAGRFQQVAKKHECLYRSGEKLTSLFFFAMLIAERLAASSSHSGALEVHCDEG
jgi:hypothetical protein